MFSRRNRPDGENAAAAALEAAVPGAALSWQDKQGGRRAVVSLPEGAGRAEAERAEKALAEAGVKDVLVTAEGAPSTDAPPARDPHADPLALGSKRRTGPPEKIRPKGVRNVVAVASGKGGVGKSTVASRIALALAAKGRRTGLLDLDIYGPSIPTLFGLEEKPAVEDGFIRPVRAAGLSLMSIGLLVAESQALAWRGPMVMSAVRQLTAETDWHAADGAPLDWLVLDTPPGTGDAHLSMIQRVVLDAAILVTTPSPLAIADLRRGQQLFERTGVPILGVVENMAFMPNGETPFGQGLDEEGLKAVGLPKLASLPIGEGLGRLPVQGGALGTEALFAVVDALLSLDQGRN